MRKPLAIVLGIAVTTMAAAVGWHQVSVPDVEARQNSLFSALDSLARMDAEVIASDGTSLGKISRYAGGDSFGSEYKSNGVFNRSSKYGGAYGSSSAFSSTASGPPEIVIHRGEKIYSVGVLTTNRYARTTGQRINPYVLQAWLKSR
jgi:hypothetical protein